MRIGGPSGQNSTYPTSLYNEATGAWIYEWKNFAGGDTPAFTVGNSFIAKDGALDAMTRAGVPVLLHEGAHIPQIGGFGIAYGLFHGVAQLISNWSSGDTHQDNPFEDGLIDVGY
jgi:hypothetical protein